MSFDVQSAEILSGMLTMAIAYLITVSLAGFFRAWTALRLGDDTPALLGFLTLNPLAHIDLIGVIILYFYRCGWGRFIPINPLNIHGRYRWLNITCAYLSDLVVYFALALFSLIALVVFYGKQITIYASPMIISGAFSHHKFAQFYPEGSSLAITLAVLLIELLFMNTFLLALNMLINGLMLLRMRIMGSFESHLMQGDLMTFMVSLLALMFFLDPLRFMLIKLLATIIQLLGMW